MSNQNDNSIGDATPLVSTMAEDADMLELIKFFVEELDGRPGGGEDAEQQHVQAGGQRVAQEVGVLVDVGKEVVADGRDVVRLEDAPTEGVSGDLGHVLAHDRVEVGEALGAVGEGEAERVARR